jgi:PAS domain S-box-containing protein
MNQPCTVFRKSRFFMFILLLWMTLFSSFFCAAATARTVKIGIYENAPKVFTDASGRPAGMFVDIIEYVAGKEGWEIDYVTGTWTEGLDRLLAGEIDLMPDVAPSPDREKLYSFHQVPVLSSWFQVYAPKGSNIKSILDLNEKKVAVLDRSIQKEAFEKLNQGFGLNTAIISVPDYTTLFEITRDKEVDAAITNRFFGLRHARDFGLEDTAVIFHPSNLFFASAAGRHQDLLTAIDTHLASLKKNPDSVYYQSLKTWTSEKVKFTLPLWIQVLGLLIIVFLIAALAGSAILRKQVTVRTRQLENVNHTLRASEKKYRELVTLANSIILRWSVDGRIQFLNDFGLQFFGYTEEEILEKHITDTIVPETESTGRNLKQIIQTIPEHFDDYEQHVNENIRRNGERVWIDWRNRLILNHQGEAIEILSIGSDITPLKQAEQKIRQLHKDLQQHAQNLEKQVKDRTAELTVAMEKALEADHLKSAFLATMSHELRTPLNSIIGFTGILLQGLAGPLNEEQQKQLGMVQKSSRHLLALINDVLDISKIEAGQLTLSFSNFDLRESIEKTVHLVQPLVQKKALDLTVEIDETVGKVTTDQRRLEQVIINLLNNAVKFTEQGHIRVTCRPENDHYLLAVEDTGIGIRPDEISGLFQPFHQIDTGLSRKREGTGLGLSICKKLIQMMNGRIDVQSREGQGSTFTICFPKNCEVSHGK